MNRCRLIFAAVLVLGSSGCATPKIVYRDRIVEVDKPVAIQPIKPEDRPAPPGPLGPRPATLPQAADLLLSKWCEAVSYILKTDPLLAVSAGVPQAALPAYPECERK